MIKKLGLFLMILLSIGTLVALYFACPEGCFTLAALKEHRIVLQQKVVSNYWSMVAGYLLIYIGMVALSLPIATLMTLAGGMLFGVLYGTLFAIIASTIGSIIAFIAVRFFIGNSFQQRYQSALQFFNKQMSRYGTLYLLGLHFVLFIPFTFINVLAGLTTVSWWTFVWTTALGMVPGSFVYSLAGQELNTIDSFSDLLSCRFILIFVILAASVLLPILLKSLRLAWINHKSGAA